MAGHDLTPLDRLRLYDTGGNPDRLPTETPFENIFAMLDTVREIGYPVNKEGLEKL